MAHQFHITPAARSVLGAWSKNQDLAGHVPTIVWTGDENGKNWEWSVGGYIRDQVPASALVILDGIEFAIEGSLRDRLDGKTLDYVNGYFFVRD
jgi:hypothetical protein